MLNSRFHPLCPVALPFQNRQRYCITIDLANPVMDKGFEDYLEPVKALIESSGVNHGTAYITVDEKVIEAGQTQRAPKPHVDGHFMPERMSWGHQSPNPWAHKGFERMPIIVASSVAGCRVWHGDFDAEPTDKGDLSHALDILGEGVVVPANHGFLLSGDCVHESMPFDRRVERTFLRIALPVGSVHLH